MMLVPTGFQNVSSYIIYCEFPYIVPRLINRKVRTYDRKYQRLAATNRFRVCSRLSHNYFTCNALSSVVIAFYHFNRIICRIVLAREMAMERIHLEVPEMQSYL